MVRVLNMDGLVCYSEKSMPGLHAVWSCSTGTDSCHSYYLLSTIFARRLEATHLELYNRPHRSSRELKSTSLQNVGIEWWKGIDRKPIEEDEVGSEEGLIRELSFTESVHRKQRFGGSVDIHKYIVALVCSSK